MPESAAPPQPIGNLDVDWDSFDSADYFARNYGAPLPIDLDVVDIVATHFGRTATWGGEAIDIGSGTNLYPALATLPFAGKVLLVERAHTNRVWLKQELRAPHTTWNHFWDRMRPHHALYQGVGDALDLLKRRASVERGNIFSLPEAQYSLGTMFFVSESITSRLDEFERATQKFVRSLQHRAPFAAAFMQESSGYRVGNREFPAYSVRHSDIERALAPVAQDVTLTVVDTHAVRDGHDGMIVATGRRRFGS